jgi:predicted nucleotidyltransferase
VSFEFSEWREDAAWQKRLARDRVALDERLDDEQREVLRGVSESLGAGDAGDVLALTIVVVFGSYARGDQGASSDLDIYFEAENLPEPLNRVDAARHYQVFGMPSGALSDELRDGREFGQRVVADALVAHDNGAFRRMLIHVDEGRTARL